MSARGFAKRVFVIDLNLHNAGLDHFHHVACHLAHALRRVGKWNSVGRVITSEPLLDSVNGSIGGIGPEALPNVTKGPSAADSRATPAKWPCRLVVDHGEHFTLGNFSYSVDKFSAVDDRVVAAMRFREPRFSRRTHGSDYSGAEVSSPLAEDRADAAGGMDKDGVAFLNIDLPDQKLDGHSLQHHRGGDIVGNFLRYFHQFISIDVADFGIAAPAVPVATRSPILKPETPVPTASTSPHISPPGVSSGMG